MLALLWVGALASLEFMQLLSVLLLLGRFSSRQVRQHQQQLDHAPRITNQTAQARDVRDRPAFITCFVDIAGCAVFAAALFSSTFLASPVSIYYSGLPTTFSSDLATSFSTS